MSMSASVHPSRLDRAPPERYDGMSVEELRLQRGDRAVAPFKTSIFTVDPNATSPVDRHAVREYWVVVEGEGLLTTPAGDTSLVPGDAVYFESHEPHQVRNTGSGPLRIHSTWWPADA